MSDTNMLETLVAELTRPVEMQRAGDGIPFIVVPQDRKTEPMEKFLSAPVRIRETIAFDDQDSFISYTNQYREQGTHIFFDQASQTYTCVLDYHEAKGDEGVDEHVPSWCTHVATYTPKQTTEWRRWLGANTKLFNQTDFATFLEDGIPEIVNPAGATMLEMAKTFEAKKNVNFSSGIRLDNGTIQFHFDEVVQGTSAGGEMSIPDSFDLGMPLYQKGQAYQIKCRLKFRLHERNLVIWYEIIRLERLVEDALASITKAIAEQTQLMVLCGRRQK